MGIIIMALKSKKISQATPLTKAEISASPSPLVPAFDGTSTPRSLSIGLLKESIVEGLSVEFVPRTYLEANYYTKEEVDARTLDPEVVEEILDLKDTVDKLDGGVETEGSVKYQVNEAKEDLIGTSGDPSSHDTINAAKNLVAESFQFINYNN
jgi:hypothetical protein